MLFLWLTGQSNLSTVREGEPPVSVISGLLFVLAGAALILSGIERRFTTRIIGFGTFALAILGPIAPNILIDGSSIPALPLHAAISFALIGLALMLIDGEGSFNSRVILSTIFGLVVFSLGVLGAYRFIVGETIGVVQGDFVPMSLPTSLGVIILGGAIVCLGWLHADIERASYRALSDAILVFSTASIFTVALVGSGFGVLANHQAVEEMTEAHLLELMEFRAGSIAALLSHQEELARGIADDPSTLESLKALGRGEIDRAELEARMEAALRHVHLLSGRAYWLARLDGDNRVAATVGRGEIVPDLPVDLDANVAPAGRGPVQRNGNLYFTYLSPILDNGEQIGTDLWYFDAAPLAALLEARTELGRGARLYLARQDGEQWKFLGAGSEGRLQLLSFAADQTAPMAQPRDWEKLFLSQGSEERLQLITQLKTHPYSVVLTVDAKEVRGAARSQLFESLAAVVLLALVISAVLFAIFRGLVRRANEVQQRLASATTSLREELERRVKAERMALRSELQTNTIVEHAGDGIITFYKDHRISTFNPAAERLFAYAEKEIIGQEIETILPDLFQESGELLLTGTDGVAGFLQSSAAVPPQAQRELTGRCRDGRVFPAEVTIQSAALDEGEWFVATVRDVSERKSAQDRITASLREKEALLREVHHRVKNNLQVISSIFRLQCRRVPDERVVKILEESQDRIQSIALLHEGLYRSQNLSQINMGSYLKDLVNSIGRSYGVADRTALTVRSEDVLLQIDRAIPSGLIVNELVTNAIKHAFPADRFGGETPSIEVTLERIDDSRIQLRVADNGIGFPEDIDVHQIQSLGLRLVVTLCRQIQAHLHIDRSPGTRFVITFENEGGH